MPFIDLGWALEVGETPSTEEVRMDSNLDSQGFEYGIGCETSLLKLPWKVDRLRANNTDTSEDKHMRTTVIVYTV